MNEADLTHIASADWSKTVVRVCLLLILSVGLFDVLFFYFQLLPSEILSRSFNIATEESYGTWVSTSLALLTGLAAGAVALTYRAEPDLRWSLGWVVVALFFLFISFDDAAKFHERLGSALHYKVEDLTGTELRSWFPSWGWQLYVAPFFVLMGCYLCWFFYRSLDRSLLPWMVSGFAMFGVAVGFDFVEGMVDREEFDLLHLMRLVEEMLEMFGTATFLYVFLLTLSGRVDLYVKAVDRI